jgi:hypothetical protein
MNQTSNRAVFAFRWRYVSLPLAMLLLAVILVVIFYNRLPFPVAYHFSSGGTPDMWAIPGLFVLWVLVPQFLLALGAIVLTWVIGWLATRFLNPANLVIKPQSIMLLTGNMVALPQIILLFAMLDIFLYNSYQTHLGLPVLAFALIVMVIGGIVLGIFFVQAMRRVVAANRK